MNIRHQCYCILVSYQMMFVSFNSNTTSVITAYSSEASEFTAGFKRGSCCSIFSFLRNVLYIFVCHFFSFSFGHCIIWPALYGFWLPFWHLQSVLTLGYLKNRFEWHHLLLIFYNLPEDYSLMYNFRLFSFKKIETNTHWRQDKQKMTSRFRTNLTTIWSRPLKRKSISINVSSSV